MSNLGRATNVNLPGFVLSAVVGVYIDEVHGVCDEALLDVTVEGCIHIETRRVIHLVVVVG